MVDLDMDAAAVFLGVEMRNDASMLENVLLRSMSLRSQTLPRDDMEAMEADDTSRDMGREARATGMPGVDGMEGMVEREEMDAEDASRDMEREAVVVMGRRMDGKEGIVGSEKFGAVGWDKGRSEGVRGWTRCWRTWMVFTALASSSLASSSRACMAPT